MTENTRNFGAAYSYINRAFGNTIEFKRQSTGNPQERSMKVETFGQGLLDRIQLADLAEPKSKTESESAPALCNLDKIFNIERSSQPEPQLEDQKDKKETKKPKKSKFVVVEEAKAVEPFKLPTESRKPGFRPPSSYDEEYDQGKLPKKRNKTNKDDKFKKSNLFQREQDLRNILEKKVKK